LGGVLIPVLQNAKGGRFLKNATYLPTVSLHEDPKTRLKQIRWEKATEKNNFFSTFSAKGF
jgi:hypothetical protein